MTQYFSQEGIDKLKAELSTRENEVRTQIAHRIAGAKELGDLSENAEYTEAREAQALNEGRVEEIREILRNAVLIDSKTKSGAVAIGSSVKVECIGQCHGDRRDFTIVGANEAEPMSGFISNESPLGKAFLGKKKGDQVEVLIPSGKAVYKIVDVK